MTNEELKKMDSLSLVNLIISIEEKYNIRFKPEDLNRENFSNIKSIEKLIKEYVNEK